VEIIRLTKITDRYFTEFKEIYSVSFPVFEQRTDGQHIYALSSENCHVDCYVEDGQFIGFIVYWEFDKYIYIEHFAIHPSQRGKNYGTLFLENLITKNDKPVILEIDPIIDDISERRYRFYEALGFKKNVYLHTHPAYREGYPDHKLVVLSSDREISEEEYSHFYADLKNIVMKIER